VKIFRLRPAAGLTPTAKDLWADTEPSMAKGREGVSLAMEAAQVTLAVAVATVARGEG